MPRALWRPLLTAICFAFVSQRYSDRAGIQAEPPSCWGGGGCFVHRWSPNQSHDFYSLVYTYLPVGGIRTFSCPPWVHTGLVQGVRLVAYMGWGHVCVGSDNNVTRHQIQAQRCAVFYTGQQRIMRLLFWARRWSHFKIIGFYAPYARHPADPPSRLGVLPLHNPALEWPERGRGSGTTSPLSLTLPGFLCTGQFPMAQCDKVTPGLPLGFYKVAGRETIQKGSLPSLAEGGGCRRPRLDPSGPSGLATD